MGCTNSKTAVKQEAAPGDDRLVAVAPVPHQGGAAAPPGSDADGKASAAPVKQEAKAGDDLVAVAPMTPHQGAPAAAAVRSDADAGAAGTPAHKTFGSKHVILSYEWSVQKQVTAVREVLKARGVPCWMDIDGCAVVWMRQKIEEGAPGQSCACLARHRREAAADSHAAASQGHADRHLRLHVSRVLPCRPVKTLCSACLTRLTRA
eukprot:COSAG01_NODE_12427_length_1741_cov_2.351401_2_plen_206_part_00